MLLAAASQASLFQIALMTTYKISAVANVSETAPETLSLPYC